MKEHVLRERTKQFPLRVIHMFSRLPKPTEAQTLGKQIFRSGTSVAANYREASRARSNAELVSKLGIVEQELDETLLWLELLVESGIIAEQKMQALHQEADELLRMTISAIRSLKRKSLN